ncbi:unnamed protein product [Clavelina lepadiformis]|uniref:Vps72/YL1 C-terminal domain-containing protein n=1 Tax=Clavelina lepadiformis TaxID=159417 RepID=A0ABP0FGZ7_CLALP
MESKKNDNVTRGKKRARSPASARGRKRKDLKENENTSNELKNVPQQTEEVAKPRQEPLCFKNPKYRENGFSTRTKVWKNLKQIMNAQKSQSSNGEVTYASIDAPPPVKPVKKYSDISGLPAFYTDPHTKLRYSNSDEYRQIQHISSDTVVGLLALRQASY